MKTALIPEPPDEGNKRSEAWRAKQEYLKECKKGMARVVINSPSLERKEKEEKNNG